ncbi:MAG: cation diffusion facilitator family transporter [Acidobacteria bacterium]|nr:cation diffusion facilitator family transporter [Acidobacteriota bacterium]MDW7984220.1 cation diffusion facilitator family transporter [Acidobacteriota bacterium]
MTGGRSASGTRRQVPLAQAAAAVSMGTTISLALLKLWGGFVTHAMTLWSLMADSFLDLLASGTNFFFIRQSFRPPDEHFHYGYGKAESIAALSQSYIIGFSALVLGYRSVETLIRPAPLRQVTTGIGILGVSWTATLILTVFLQWVVRRTGSVAIRADAFHYETDLLTNLGGLVSLLLVQRTGRTFWDGLFSLGIVLYMLVGAFGIARRSVQELMDRTLTPEENRRLMEIIQTFHPAVQRPHDFRSRRAGRRIFIEFHIEVDRSYSFEAAHDLAEDLIERIRQEFPMAEVTVHVDPEGTTR